MVLLLYLLELVLLVLGLVDGWFDELLDDIGCH